MSVAYCLGYCGSEVCIKIRHCDASNSILCFGYFEAFEHQEFKTFSNFVKNVTGN
jgi:hypothetical protein